MGEKDNGDICMRVINLLIFLIVFVLFLLWFFVRKKRDEDLSIVLCYIKHHGYLIIGLFIVNAISFGLGVKDHTDSFYIAKESYGGAEIDIPVLLEKEDEKQSIILKVRARKLEDVECKQRMEDAFHIIDESLKGENDSLKHITRNLNLVLDREKYPFDVECVPIDYGLITSEGVVKNEKDNLLQLGYSEEEIEEGISTKIKIILWYEGIKKEKTYEVVVYEKETSEVEQLFHKVQKELEGLESSALYQEGFLIPTEIGDVKILPHPEKGLSSRNSLLIGLLIIILLIMKEKEDQKQQMIKRNEMLIRSYAWFVNEMTLLLGAGMQTKNIFLNFIKEYEKGPLDFREPLIQEIRQAYKNFELGMPEEQVYYSLGRALKLPCYVKIMTLLEQNVKKGSKGLAVAFEKEEIEALEERKNLAKRLGEEAGTKLLGPMLLLLVIIMMIIMIPAFLSFM